MYLTLLALFGLILLAVALRRSWPHAGSIQRRSLLVALGLLILPSVLNLVLRWESTSNHLNGLLLWISVFGYVLAAVSFTLLRPVWLTSLIATILVLPVFSSSVIGPLHGAFTSETPILRSVSSEYFLQLTPWSSGPGRNSGADFTLFYKPTHSRFLRRTFVGGRLYNTQCLTPSTFATLDPVTATIHLHCPALSSDPAEPPSGTNLEYAIPPGARSPSLSARLRR